MSIRSVVGPATKYRRRAFPQAPGVRGGGLPVDTFGSQHVLDSLLMDSDAGPLGMEAISVAPGPRCAWQESNGADGSSLVLCGVGGLRAGDRAVAAQSNPFDPAESMKSRRDGGFRARVTLSNRVQSRVAYPGSNKYNMRGQDRLVRRQSGEGRQAASLGGRGNGQETAEASTEWSRTATT